MAGEDQSPPKTAFVFTGTAEVKLMLSIAAGGCVPPASFFHEKINLNVVPANVAGNESVNVCTPVDKVPAPTTVAPVIPGGIVAGPEPG